MDSVVSERGDGDGNRAAVCAPSGYSLEVEDRLQQLARLTPGDYDKRRSEEAALLEMRVGTLNREVVARRPRTAGVGGSSQADELVRLASDEVAEFFVSEGAEEAYATIPVADHLETWPMKRDGFRRWLQSRFYAEHGKAAGAQAVQDALGVLIGKAQFEAGLQLPVYTRVGKADGKVYLDLGSKDWNVVEIDAEGWRLLESSPVKFRWRRSRESAAFRSRVTRSF